MTEPAEMSGGEVPNETSDRSLLAQVKRGNVDAATQLYLRYAQRLNDFAIAKSSRTLACKVGAEEIVQSVFGSFFRGTKNGCYDIPDGGELWGLFLRITLNKIRAKGTFHLAAKRDSRLTKGSDVLDGQFERVEGGDEIALKVLEISIGESLESFPSNYREIVDLRVQGFEIEEIAKQTKHSKRTVERILQEVRKKLSHLMDEQ